MLMVIGIINALTFIVFAVDKYKAKKKKYRISEKILLTLLLVGSVGGYLAMFVFRHKTRKWYFHLVGILGVLIYNIIYLKILYYIVL